MPAKESYTAVELGKEKEDEVISGTRDGIKYQRPNQELNKKIPHVTTRTSTQAKHVLPSWTRRCRAGHTNPEANDTKNYKKKKGSL